MKTSRYELQAIESYLLSPDNHEEKAHFRARLLTEPALQESVHWQQAACAVVNEYGRQKLRDDIHRVAQNLFTLKEHRPFRDKIRAIFRS